MDSSGNIYIANASSNTVSKITPDTVAPVLTNYTMEQTVYQNKPYNPLVNISCSDNVEGDCTSRVAVTGTVDIATVGTYELSYSYTDASGNVSNTMNRTVNVVADTIAPTVTLYGQTEMTIYRGKNYNES